MNHTAQVRTWLGVPYATPPLGALRHRAPRPPAPGPGIRECRAPAPRCPQAPALGGEAGATSEDCLVVDIHAPEVDGGGGGGLPVLVWLHGGGFSRGGGGWPGAGGLAVRARAIVVAVQYRYLRDLVENNSVYIKFLPGWGPSGFWPWTLRRPMLESRTR